MDTTQEYLPPYSSVQQRSPETVALEEIDNKLELVLEVMDTNMDDLKKIAESTASIDYSINYNLSAQLSVGFNAVHKSIEDSIKVQHDTNGCMDDILCVMSTISKQLDTLIELQMLKANQKTKNLI
jgi:hypothetical protein